MRAAPVKILVTGASGFVGGAFLRRFATNPDVTLLGVARRALPLSNYRRVDLSVPFELDYEPEVVIHAAALASPWARRADYQRHNVEATRNVIAFCEARGRPRLLYLSSGSVFYRNEHQFELTETSPIGPDFVNDYAATKYAGEQLVRHYAGEAVILRPRAVFGPGDTVLFPRILHAARRNRLPLLIPDGEPARGDLIYIDSLCDYLLAAASRPTVSGAYNLTNAEPVVIQSFLIEALERLGLPSPRRRVRVATAMQVAAFSELVYRLLRLPGEPPVTRFGVGVLAWSKTFDVSLALRDFGPPSVSVRNGLQCFVEWQLAQWSSMMSPRRVP
jgi:nucleoside-diphosphate-sugar epimerase